MRKYLVAAIFVILLSPLCTFDRWNEVEAAERNWQDKWEETVRVAKIEGQVTLYASGVYGQVFAEFQKRYPEIKVVHVSGSGSETIQRVMSERRAGRYLADLYISGAGTGYFLYGAKVLEPIKPALIIPEVVDESKWWMGKHKYMDTEGKYFLAFNEVVLPFVAYNTKQVDSGEFKSYWDLLQPKWKGRMVVLDPAVRAAADNLVFIYATPDLGPSFIRRLFAEMDLAASRDSRQIVDWLGTGRYSLSVLTSPSRADLDAAQGQGLPINWLSPKELKEGAGTSTSNGNVGIFNGAPHPNAAKVALNWLLSREGQIVYQRLQYGSNSLRADIPKESVPLFSQRQAGVRYVDINSPESQKYQEPIRKIIDEVWKKR